MHKYIYEQFHCTTLQRGEQVDHIDGNRVNNAIGNLRKVDVALNNLLKTKARKDSKSGIKGVTKTKSGRWSASITSRGKKYNLGTFDHAQEAKKAYDDKLKELCSKK